jgi:ubiquinone/menaquinone biosynthesis C-methylase UbiE
MYELSEVNKNDTVLDIACGPVLVTTAFATKAKHVTGIDITPAMIDKAKEIQKDKKLENISWKIGDATNLPFDDESFSIVITRYSFHHY